MNTLPQTPSVMSGQTDDALKPCPNPWCEDTAVQCPEHMEGGFYRIGCTCGVATPAFRSEAEAVTAWNARIEALSNTPAQGEAVALAEQLRDGADKIIAGDTIFSDEVVGLLWEAADALIQAPAPDDWADCGSSDKWCVLVGGCERHGFKRPPAPVDMGVLREALADLVSWFDDGPSSYGPWIIRSGPSGADDAVEAARAALSPELHIGGEDDALAVIEDVGDGSRA